ncbi:MLO-like protein 3 [Nicotiana tomentosiformis]|uniref:MLO-like protein 3 n=1 Tax=Nicotiana tomentosiformis TaxID=4098 RepID=UPI00051BC240|nr:MLO-like protein 3 [Nicotiana tomentosiformis]XP_016513649.1 PREDICTED: MLO-like protein 3 [Nicotiana tabacum]
MTTEGGGGSTSSPSRTLLDTPTWALAIVCFIFIFLGIFIEHLIHLLCHWLKKHRKTALFEAVEKLKSVLMQLGFLSLLLAVIQRPISKICIPNRIANSMLPCHQRELTSLENSKDHCGSRGMTSFMSQNGINQLNNFIFVLAMMQIVYSVVTMALGRAKMKRWKTWEKESQTIEYMAANDPNRFRFTRETTFGRRHMNKFTTTSTHLWIKCFFRQFFHSVAKVDYLTLRHGFISAHLSSNNAFNFQKYINRSLEDDFKVVVGISPFMWLLVVIFLLVDVHGWNVYLWVSFLPLITVLVIGTKLETIVAQMALQLETQQDNDVIIGSPTVQPNDNLFWFNQPQFVLTLLYYTLFINAFELAFFIWVTWQFGIKSCYHENVEIIVIRVVLAVTVQVLCSYITLPLYALVTQMGSHFKRGLLEEHIMQAIKQWHAQVKNKKKLQQEEEAGAKLSTNNRVTTDQLPEIEFSSHNRVPTVAEFSAHEIHKISQT